MLRWALVNVQWEFLATAAMGLAGLGLAGLAWLWSALRRLATPTI